MLRDRTQYFTSAMARWAPLQRLTLETCRTFPCTCGRSTRARVAGSAGEDCARREPSTRPSSPSRTPTYCAWPARQKTADHAGLAADANRSALGAFKQPRCWALTTEGVTGTETEILFMKKIGFQRRSRTLRIACTEKGARVTAISALQPAALPSDRIA
jgi:hypothetical protein